MIPCLKSMSKRNKQTRWRVDLNVNLGNGVDDLEGKTSFISLVEVEEITNHLSKTTKNQTTSDQMHQVDKNVIILNRKMNEKEYTRGGSEG